MRTELEKHLDKITEELLMGLNTDGAHHKQHSLEAVLRMIAGQEWVDNAHATFQWQKGIPA